MPKVDKPLAVSVAQTSLLREGPWSMKLFYLCFFGYVGIITAYLGLYLGAVGLSGTQIDSHTHRVDCAPGSLICSAVAYNYRFRRGP